MGTERANMGWGLIPPSQLFETFFSFPRSPRSHLIGFQSFSGDASVQHSPSRKQGTEASNRGQGAFPRWIAPSKTHDCSTTWAPDGSYWKWAKNMKNPNYFRVYITVNMMIKPGHSWVHHFQTNPCVYPFYGIGYPPIIEHGNGKTPWIMEAFFTRKEHHL